MKTERLIDFSRDRHMLCRACGNEWVAQSQWVHDFYLSETAGCPECAEGCESDLRPRVTHDPENPALSDEYALTVNWYHTSTHDDWPRAFYDPSEEWSDQHRRHMKACLPNTDWGARQMSLALHVGTYEAAIHNMLRRIADQADRDKQFYLYRVRLVPTVRFRQELLVDPAPAFGDLRLADVCPPGIDIARYLNLHEDQGEVSLALGRDAIESVQRVAVPQQQQAHPVLLSQVADRFTEAASEPVPPPTKFGVGGHTFEVPSVTPMMLMRNAVCDDLSKLVPAPLSDDFERVASQIVDPDELDSSLGRIAGMIDMIENPNRTLKLLDGAPLQAVRT